jgi:hypothetical protein
MHLLARCGTAVNSQEDSLAQIAFRPKEGVGGSSPSEAAKNLNVHSGHIGDSLFRTHRLHIVDGKRIIERLQGLFFKVDVAKVIVHERHDPRVFIDFLESECLTLEHLRDVDLLVVKANASAGGDHQAAIVEGVIQLTKRIRSSITLGWSQNGD